MKKTIITFLALFPFALNAEVIQGSSPVRSTGIFINQDGGDTIMYRGTGVFTKSSAGAWTQRDTNLACIAYSANNTGVKPIGMVSFCYESVSTDADSGKLDIRFKGKMSGKTYAYRLDDPESGSLLTDTTYTTQAGTYRAACVGDFFFPTSIDSLCMRIRPNTATHGVATDSTRIRIHNIVIR